MPYWEHHWQHVTGLTRALMPLSVLFCTVVRVRRAAYRAGILKSSKPPVPVIIIGNISVGGTGKSPLAAALARELRQRGRKPGIVLRGYRARGTRWPLLIAHDTGAAAAGDEAIVHFRTSECPVVVDPNRARGAQYLYEHCGCDTIVSDDGLQHYALARDVEIAVLDGTRGVGNGWCLPAGPLRETVRRLRTVDAVLTQHDDAGPTAFRLEPRGIRRVDESGETLAPSALHGQRVHAVAGIGNPRRFFAALTTLGMDPIPHPLPDHHVFRDTDLRFGDALPVIMTLKDAVKCKDFAAPNHYYLAVTATLPAGFVDSILAKIARP